MNPDDELMTVEADDDEFLSVHDIFEIGGQEQTEGEKEEAKEPLPEVDLPPEKPKEPSPAPRQKKKTPLKERVGQLTRKLRETEAKARELEAKHAEYVKQATQTQIAAVSVTADSLDSELKGLKKQIALARENGNIDEELALQDKYLDTSARLRRFRDFQSSQPVEEPQDKSDKNAVKEPNLSPVEAEWLDNVGFFDWTQEEQFVAKRLYKRLSKEGYDTASADFYEELDSLLRRIPTLKTRYEMIDALDSLDREDEDEDEDDEPVVPTRQTVKKKATLKRSSDFTPTPVKSGPQAGNTDRKAKYKLTENDAKTMRAFGFDPKNIEDVKNFLREGKGMEV